MSTISYSALLARLNQSKVRGSDPALYETIAQLLRSLDGNQSIINNDITVNKNALDGPILTYEADNELANSRALIAGTNVTIDKSIGGEAIISATGGGGSTTIPPIPFFVNDDYDEGFTIPGPKGDTGSSGSQGIQGNPGLSVLALDGIDGQDGISIIGPQGLTGNTGLQGFQGIPGFNFEENDYDQTGLFGPPGISQSGRLLNVQRITATGAYTYTPTNGTSFIIIELQGAGAGGGGVASPGTVNVSLGQGGGGGGWLWKKLTANFSGATGSIGAAGTGGVAGNNAGNNGNNTTFIDSSGAPVTYTASGGLGGAGSAGGVAPVVFRGTFGGSATNGDINVIGGYSQILFSIANPVAVSGGGGSSHYSSGGIPSGTSVINTSFAGNNSGGKGGGGSGAVAVGTGAAQAGGNGTDGIVIIWEYS